jgi:lipid A 3-O-deacylase
MGDAAMAQPTTRKRARIALALAASLAAGSAAAQEDYREPDFITLGAGAFDINDDMTAAEFDIQVRLNRRLWIFKPQVGMFVTDDAGFYAYAGIYTDIYFGRRWVLSPSFSVGGNDEGDGKDLGGPVEFRSAVELAYRFDDSSRLGLQFGHLSNASLYDRNPGEEFLILNYSLPTTVFER